MLDIVTIGEDVLRQKAQKVTEFTPELKILIDAMFASMEEEYGIGLAAPQIGMSKRLFVTHAQDDQPRVFINPEIIQTSVETVSYEEGCLSVPGVFAQVIRPEVVTIQAQDQEGKRFVLEAKGMLARVIQHENDHLDGVLFVDRLDEQTREKVLKAYEKKKRVRRRSKNA